MEILLIIVPESAMKAKGFSDWPDHPYREHLISSLNGVEDKSRTPLLISNLPNKKATLVLAQGLKESMSTFDMQTLARKIVSAVSGFVCRNFALLLLGISAQDSKAFSTSLIAASIAANHQLPKYKSTKSKSTNLEVLSIFGLAEKISTKRVLAIAEGNNFARSFTATPGNFLTPKSYVNQIKKIAKIQGWGFKFYDVKTLTRMKAGAFLSVVQGSPNRDGGIVHLRYTPKARSRQSAVSLIGKGICFDTGGTNLKPARHMFGMHEDMAGSATALGSLIALSQLKVNFPVDCWLAIAENHIGSKAYKPNDVVRAIDGQTIEVVHTDAEGRMILADTLALAARRKPRLILDFATLTGACVSALGNAYSGVFTNCPQWHGKLIEAGANSGERVWPFPMDQDFDQDLESQVADIKQCSLEGGPDHILAARFLNRFVPKSIPWVHLDMAASGKKGGLGPIPSDTTGFGVAFTVELLRILFQREN